MKKKTDPTSSAVETESAKPEPSGVPVGINGETYNLSFEFSDLAKAERLFRGQGHRLNLLIALPELSLESIREVFPCAVHRHHPDLTFDQAQALVTMESVYNIATAIVEALNAASSQHGK